MTEVPRPPSPTDDPSPGETQPSAQSDREVVARIGAGDVAAFEALYRAHAPALLAFAHSQLRSRELAEDLVQDLFLALWRYRERWDLRSSLKAYLLGALRNRIISYRRSLQAREGGLRRVEAATLASVAGPSRADHRVREAELAEAIEKAIEALSPRCRETFLLVRQQNLSYAEAAEVLGISVKAVEMNMVRALAALRRELDSWRA
ncbi:MAG TPA: RNA polymerase sigma-70 factor [Longimicrobiales bacterium]